MRRHYRRGATPVGRSPSVARACVVGAQPRAATSASSASSRPSGVWTGASTSGSVPERAQRLARDRADRDDPGAGERARGVVEEARGRGAREGRVVGAERGVAGVRRRAPRRPSGRAPAPSTSAPRSRSASGSTSRASCGAGDQRALHGDVARAPRRATRRPSARGRCRPRCRARAARARCPGRSRRSSGRRARGRRARGDRSCSAPFGLVTQMQVERVERRDDDVERLDPDRRRLDDARAEGAQARGELAGLGARAGDGDADARAAAARRRARRARSRARRRRRRR